MSPTVIDGLIRTELNKMIDVAKWKKVEAAERSNRTLLNKVSQNWAKVKKAVSAMSNYFPFLSEDSDLWDYPPRTRKKKRRIRNPPLARAVIEAVIEAQKAGLTSGVVTVDGVSLSFGEEHNAKPNGHTIETADELRKLI